MSEATQHATFSRIQASLYLLCGVVALYLLSVTSLPTVLVDTDPANPWSRVVNLRSNSYHLWQWDPVSSTLSQALTTISSLFNLPAVTPTCIQSFILLFGTILVSLALRPTRGAPHPRIGFLASVPTVLLVATVGWDPIALSIIAWVPLLAIAITALIFIQRRGHGAAAAPVWIIGAFLSVQHALSSNHMALISAIGAFLLAYVLAFDDTPIDASQDAASSSPPHRASLLPVVLVVIAPALVATFIRAPHAPFPDYPALAHVVPDDGLDGIMHPLIGKDYPIHVLDRTAVKSELYLPALVLTGILFLSWLLMRKRLRFKGTIIVLLTLALATLTLLDVALPEQYAALAPLMSLSRLTPWGTIFCITSIALASAAWLAGVFLLSNHARKTSAVLLILALCSCGYREWIKLEERRVEYAALMHPTVRSVAISPSAATLRRHLRATGAAPGHLLPDIAQLSSATWENISARRPSFEASAGVTSKRIQKDPSAPPAPPIRFPRPTGSESLSISFPTPVTAKGLALDLGKHTSDFPRGLTLLTGPCKAPESTLATYPDWQGAVELTPSGYPYFLGQGDVRIVFASEATFSALCLRQTQSSVFDWYIKGVRLMKAETASNGQEPHL